MTYREYLNKCMAAFVFVVQACFSNLPAETVPLKADFAVESDWGTGYQGKVTITNTSSASTVGWAASFSLEGQEQISSLWGGSHTVNGAAVQVTNPSWQGAGIIPGAGSTTFGFVVQNTTPKTRALSNLQATGSDSGIPTPTPTPGLAAPELKDIRLVGRSGYIVSWNKVPRATSYTLQQSTDSSFGNPTVVAQGRALSKRFRNQANGTYYYRVSATRGTLNSSFSAPKSVTIGSTPPVELQAPVLAPIQNASSGSYQISWNAVANAQSYELEESTASDFATSKVLVSSAATSHQVSNQPQGTYYYRVNALAGNVSSPESNIQSAIVTQGPPPPPQTGALVEGYWESWNSATPIGSIVNMKVDLIDVAFVTFTRTGANTFSVTGLDTSLETLAQFVSAAHAAGKKVKVSVGGATYGQGPLLQSAADATGMAQAISQFVQQNNLDGVDFDIEDYPAANLQVALLQQTRQLLGANALISYTPKTPSSTTLPYSQVIKDGHQYLNSIAMMAYDAYPAYNYQEDVQALIAMGVPAAKIVVGLMPGPDDLGEMTSVDEIRIASEYIEQHGLGGIMFWSLNRDIENRTGLGASAATNMAWSVLHDSPVPPTPPASLQAPVLEAINNAGAASYTVSWNAVANAQTYRLERSTSSSFSNPTTVVNAAAISHQVMNQAAGTYYYRVMALAGSSSSPASNVQSATVGQTPPPPSSTGAFVEGYWESWNSTNSISSIVNMKNDRICVSFITFTRTGGNTFSVSGLDASPETLRQLVSAAHAAGRKVKASVGGASYGQGQFLQSVADANGMAQAVAQYVQQNGLDGVDYDIEDFPAANLQIALLKRTRELLPNSIISYTPMTPASTTQPFTQVIRDGHQYVDYISMMCYNAGFGYNYQQDVQALIAMGVPAAKVVVGLMPGRDDMGEMTSLDEIKAACNYINQKGLGGIMFWSLNRDLSNVTGLGASAATNASYAILHP